MSSNYRENPPPVEDHSHSTHLQEGRLKAVHYRPVLLASICCKVCEHIIAKSIMQHLEDHGLLTDFQHSFRAKRSCKTQLQTLVDELFRGVTNGKQYDIAIMDFSKAFDVVPHKRFPKKAPVLWHKRPMPGWIKDFLKNIS